MKELDTIRQLALNMQELTGEIIKLCDQLIPKPAPAPTVDLFNAGSSYPAMSSVILPTSMAVPVGTTRCIVPVRLDKPSPNTVIAYLRCANGAGGRVKRDYTQAVIFQPGETEQTLTFDTASMVSGSSVQVLHRDVPDGASRAQSGIRITADTDAPAPIAALSREPLPVFQPLGKLLIDHSGKQIIESKLWLDRLAHGRSQPANAETGYYAPNNFTLNGDDLVLRSFKLPEPHIEGTLRLPFAASILTGLMHNQGDTWPRVRPELSFRYGSMEWEAKMPNRRDSWPALWLCSVRDGRPAWPFEIDVFEGFYYNGSFKTGAQLSANLHGGREGSNSRQWTRPMMRLLASMVGSKDDIDTAFHKYAVTIDREFIRIFFDGVQIMAWTNPFTSTAGWYPIMNVAVKAPVTSAYDQGIGDMTVRRFKLWKSE